MPLIKKYVFDQILADSIKAGRANTGTRESLMWYMRKIKNYNITKSQLISKSHDAKRDKLRVLNGRMYFFSYDPKTKDDLPFYDKFPLIFLVDVKPEYFTGLNLHYLPPMLRVNLMKQMYDYSSDSRYDQKTQVKISYQILRQAQGAAYYKPCFKKYLFPHTRSSFMEMLPSEWAPAAFLPVAQWEKSSEASVWKWAKEQI